MLAYYGTDISPNQTESVEGYLICRNVPIARTGKQDYLARELQLDGDPERVISVDRLEEDVFSPATLASFEGKPVTDGHPPENLGPENYSNYLRGHVQNVRRDGDYIVADLYINDAVLASEIQNGVKREVSCGYFCTYAPTGSGYKQTKIIGNHVAVVPRGRAGATVAIKDSAGEAQERSEKMSDFWRSVLTAFGMAAKDATPEELTQMVETAGTALDAVPAADAAQEAEPAKKPEGKDEDKAEVAAPPAEAEDAEPPKGDDIGSKLDKLLRRVETLEKKVNGHGGPAKGEDALDKAIKDMESGEAATIPASADCSGKDACKPMDSGAELLRAMRPTVLSIEDKATRDRVVDALLSAVHGGNPMGDIMRAAQDSARDNAERQARTKYEKSVADQQTAYDARNPHKAKKEDR